MSEEGFNKRWPDTNPGRALRRAIRQARGEVKPVSTTDVIYTLKTVYTKEKVLDHMNDSGLYSILTKGRTR